MPNQEVVDPVEVMLKKTGCIELHYKVQVKFKFSMRKKVLKKKSNFRSALLRLETGVNVKRL